ncbi:MAG: efflux RND transporter periplasmic adaptor subunit [Planctomycetes bacterium]|nr:efflux RND transporter periplasmic adaptor subunit [Planctomycetota bacterium]
MKGNIASLIVKLALVVLLPAIGFVFGVALADAVKARFKTPQAEVTQKLTNVAVQVVEPQVVTDRLAIRGVIEPWVSVRLSAETSGRLVFVGKEEGDAVRQGERLFGIDKAVLQANLASAQAHAEYAVLTHERSRKMFADNAVSKDELDRTKAEMDAALAAVELAKAQLNDADAMSPISGFFDAKLAEVGEYMNPGSPLGDVVDTSRVKLIVQVPEKDISFVRVGETMNLVVEALGGEVRQGKVIFVKQVAEADTLTFPVHLEVANADGRIRPGMIAKVELVRRSVSDAVAVNIFCVRRHENGYRVFVENDGVAHARDVQLGVFDGAVVQVLSGLNVGDRLIVKGQREIVDGTKVAVVEGDKEPTKPSQAIAPPDAVETPTATSREGSPGE